MRINDKKWAAGYFTLSKFVRGRTLAELERDLGVRTGRLSREGAFMLFPLRLPLPYEFELRGYGIIPDHEFEAYNPALKKLDDGQMKKYTGRLTDKGFCLRQSIMTSF